jgi:2-C-methyl-D-erythritol 4-phosphate cytidylyltransferase/2-C-methyl-D-erythritol 2,4-cyclodiphosphate synthase
MKVVAAILAAGQGTRFGSDKTRVLLRGRPLWDWSFQTYKSTVGIDRVVLVGSEANNDELSAAGETIRGGATRQESSLRALEAAGDADILLVHDAARPFITSDLIERVLEQVKTCGAAAAAVPVTDTIKRVAGDMVETLDRRELWAMQTPQGARVDLLRQAHAAATAEMTDEMALLEAIGVNPRLVKGDPNNFKVTTAEDLARANSFVGSGEIRTGIGYDIHAFSADPNRALTLGGLVFEGAPGLEGHSDADVLLHAITDAILGAAAMGDIGQHFPNTEPAWRGAPSIHFLRHAGELVSREGWEITNLDATLICEKPKVMGRSLEIRETIATALHLEIGRVSIKATTNEGLGSLGRGEGISAFSVATLRRR